MGAVSRVPELSATAIGPLGARDVWTAARRRGLRGLARDAFARFRFGDGFSHARALGLQFSLAAVPLVIAGIGVSGALEAPWLRQVLRQTILQLTPGASDALIRETLPSPGDDSALRVSALVLVLLSAAVALTTAMAQVERGANRVYGIDRDRPTREKYGRALVMAAVAGLPVMVGSLLLLAGGALAAAVEEVSGVDDDLVVLVVWPAGAVLVVGAVTLLLRFSPARRQPGWSLLLLGGVLAFTSWVLLTAVLAAALELAGGLGSVYGPLTGVMALLVWAQMASAAILLGLAVSAELELEAARTLPATPGRRAPAGDR